MRSPTNRPSEAFLSDGLCHTQIHLFYASGHLVCGKPICAAPHTIPPKQKRDLQLRYMGVDPTHKVDPLVPYNRQPKFQN